MVVYEYTVEINGKDKMGAIEWPRHIDRISKHKELLSAIIDKEVAEYGIGRGKILIKRTSLMTPILPGDLLF